MQKFDGGAGVAALATMATNVAAKPANEVMAVLIIPRDSLCPVGKLSCEHRRVKASRIADSDRKMHEFAAHLP